MKKRCDFGFPQRLNSTFFIFRTERLWRGQGSTKMGKYRNYQNWKFGMVYWTETHRIVGQAMGPVLFCDDFLLNGIWLHNRQVRWGVTRRFRMPLNTQMAFGAMIYSWEGYNWRLLLSVSITVGSPLAHHWLSISGSYRTKPNKKYKNFGTARPRFSAIWLVRFSE